MGNFFPRWTNWLPLQIIIAVIFLVGGITAAVAYWFTPKYTKVGYEPAQPVPFSHKRHAGEIGLDCRYCHSFVEVSGHANVPTNQTCYNCHGPDKGQIKKESEKLAMVRDADKNNTPIQWVKVHKSPDFVYFNHSVHLNRGISCVNCHGRIDQMEVVKHVEPHSMSWCLDCHRAPEKKLRPLDEITNLAYAPDQIDRRAFYAKLGLEGGALDEAVKGAEAQYGAKVAQSEVGLKLKDHGRIAPPESCAACHR
jgi:formate-dependent nitrite reductase cytochrome c552 subunit